MIVLPCNKPVFYDVDDTLINWYPKDPNDPRIIDILTPSTRFKRAVNEMGEEIDELIIEQGDWTAHVIPHLVHIEQLKKHKLGSHTVIVWSAGGWEWAKTVIETLGLSDYVDLIIEKPYRVIDDLPVREFMPKSEWIEYK